MNIVAVWMERKAQILEKLCGKKQKDLETTWIVGPREVTESKLWV